MSRIVARYAFISAFALTAGLSPALATFHFMVVQEVFPGTPANPQAQYVMLRMTARGQTFVNTTFIEVQDPEGILLGTFGTIDHDVAAAGTLGCVYPNCPAIVIGTAAAQSLLGFAFDQIVDAQLGRVALPLSGGRVCFRSASDFDVDCVAYGAFTSTNTMIMPANTCDPSLGVPAAALAYGFALTRKQFVCGGQENSADFQNRFPHPIANSGANANADADADGLINILDCGDGSPASLYFPSEVTRDSVAAGSPTVLSWESQSATTGSSTRYDVVKGNLGDLLSTGSYAAASCLAPRVSGLSITDPAPDPSVGRGVYYLVRAASNCGAGTYGDSTLVPDPRDSLAASPCP